MGTVTTMWNSRKESAADMGRGRQVMDAELTGDRPFLLVAERTVPPKKGQTLPMTFVLGLDDEDQPCSILGRDVLLRILHDAGWPSEGAAWLGTIDVHPPEDGQRYYTYDLRGLMVEHRSGGARVRHETRSASLPLPGETGHLAVGEGDPF